MTTAARIGRAGMSKSKANKQNRLREQLVRNRNDVYKFKQKKR